MLLAVIFGVSGGLFLLMVLALRCADRGSAGKSYFSFLFLSPRCVFIRSGLPAVV